MPRDNSGNYTLPAGNPVVSGTTITSNWANDTMPDLGNEITNSLSRDGQGGMLAPLQFVDGTSLEPGIAWVLEPTMGFWRSGTQDMRAVVGNRDVIRMTLDNRLEIQRDYGGGEQWYLALDSQGWINRLAGFLDTGLQQEFAGDLDDILVNSQYWINNSQGNVPADMVSSGTIITMPSIISDHVTQVLVGQLADDMWKIWQRTRSSTVWGAWKLVVDGGAMTLRLTGYKDDGFTTEFNGDLNSILENSKYYFYQGNVTNEPQELTDSDGWGSIETLMFGDNSAGTQRLSGLLTANAWKEWLRDRTGNVWGAWKLVVDGGAFTQRLVGYEDDLTHNIFTGDLNTLVINSKYVIASVSVTNAPADFTSGRGFIDTDADSGSTLFTTQVLYGAWGTDNNYKQWMRVQDNGVWGAWVLVVDGAAGGAAVGQVTAFAQAVADVGAGWLYADGSAVSRTTYPLLFTALGIIYGDGDGSTTFNLPDYRGEILRGQDSGRGLDPDAGARTDRGDGTTGDNVGTNQAHQFEDHFHGQSAGQLSNLGSQGRNADGAVGVADSGLNTTSPQSGSFGPETRPVNIYVRYYIFAGL